MTGKERLERRHKIHGVVRGVIAAWNDRAQVLHMGHKIDLGAEITEALMAMDEERAALGQSGRTEEGK